MRKQVVQAKTIEKGLMFRIYPNTAQVQQVNKTIGCARFVYNYFLDKRIKAYNEDGITLGYSKCSALLTDLKRDGNYLWLQEADKFVLQNSLRDLDRAYQNFFKAVAEGNLKQGFPKFKAKHKSKHKYRTNITNGNIRVDMEARQIKLP